MVDLGAHHSFGQFFLHDRWETFMSINDFLNSSYFTSITGRFEGVVPSFTMIESSLASTKTKRVIEITYYLHSKEVDVLILEIKVGVVCSGDNGTM
jgi:hypothetical protein